MKKIIVFDFDGTLSKKGKNIWKEIWKSCGWQLGSTSYYAALYRSFMKGEITHQQWCAFTCEALKYKNFNEHDFYQIVKDYCLVDGFEETISALKRAGYKLHIVSGGVKEAIICKLKKYVLYFDSINANSIKFSKDGVIDKIEGTKYDFEGKARFISQLIEREGVSEKDILFVGNGSNDEWAFQSGCKTLCINPDGTNSENKTIWHDEIGNLTNLKQILPKVNNITKIDKEIVK